MVKEFFRLLSSSNGSESLKYCLPFELYQDRSLHVDGGWKDYVDYEHGPVPCLCFEADEEGVEAEKKIDTFLHDILMPIVIKTNALVLCSASRACTLGMRFAKASQELASNLGCARFLI
jgi:hypothetical protein